jgi:predicted pyridoxine 5'-phosphate oxidase superfamily flavin-nucleotide-binding protein
LFFLIPGHTETLRVSGTAQIILDSSVQERHAVNGRKPLLALAVTVEQVFMHCSKAVVRSQLWQTEHWPERRSAPTLAQWVHSVNLADHSVDEIQGWHDDDAANRLY